MINEPSPQRPFWLDFLILIGVDALVVLVGALILRDPNAISNMFFISSVILVLIAVIPALTEFGENTRMARRALIKGERYAKLLKEKEPKHQRGGRTTYLFGLAGVLAFVLSIVTS